MVVINGQNVKDVTGISVLEVLNKSGYNTNHIAVELNEKILPKSRYGDTILCDGDKLEIVTFVGGG